MEDVRPRLEDEPSPRPVRSSEVAYRGRIWDVRSDEFEFGGDGGFLRRDYIDHPGAVAVVPLDEQGRVLFLRQYRHPVGMRLWEVPAGLLDVAGETYLDAAARELAEEADLVATEWRVLTDFFNSPGSSSEAIRIYLAQGLSLVPEESRHERTEEESEIEFCWVPLDEAVNAVLQGKLHNPSAVVGVLAAAASRQDYDSLRPGDAPWPEHPGRS